MVSTKAWYFSKTIWASIIAVAATLASAFGIVVDDQTQSQLAENAVQFVTVVASLLAVFSRLTATSLIR